MLEDQTKKVEWEGLGVAKLRSLRWQDEILVISRWDVEKILRKGSVKDFYMKEKTSHLTHKFSANFMTYLEWVFNKTWFT